LCLPSSAWIGHIPFLFLLFNLARPWTFVELGVDLGTSYLAACEAARRFRTGTRCLGIDTWQGDDHAGRYDGDLVFEGLRALTAARYPACALVRRTFDQAAQRFADRSIDLLHIDGLHTYEAVAHDFATWQPKLSDRSIVLFHDTEVREWGFGVWRFWADIRTDYRSFEFNHGFGLGVLATGRSLPHGMQELLAYVSHEDHRRELQDACQVAADTMPQRIEQRGAPEIPQAELLDRLVMNRAELRLDR
jgi:hypothetical protein